MVRRSFEKGSITKYICRKYKGHDNQQNHKMVVIQQRHKYKAKLKYKAITVKHRGKKINKQDELM